MRVVLDSVFSMPGAVPVLGAFDGIHIGHQALLKKMTLYDAPRVIISYANAPAAFFGREAPVLTTIDERLALFERYHPDAVWLRPFDEALAALAPDAFVDELVARFSPRAIITGYNHRFGAGAAGDTALLERLSHTYGYEAVTVPPVMMDGEAVSSTRIRQALRAGDIEHASRMLGYAYMLEGKIEYGLQLARKMGFPTANMRIADKMLPKYGVYTGFATVQGTKHPAVLNIGVKPTVNGAVPLVEVHLLDAAVDLYGDDMKVELLCMLRPEKRFENLDALKAQLEKDVAGARLYFEKR